MGRPFCFIPGGKILKTLLLILVNAMKLEAVIVLSTIIVPILALIVTYIYIIFAQTIKGRLSYHCCAVVDTISEECDDKLLVKRVFKNHVIDQTMDAEFIGRIEGDMTHVPEVYVGDLVMIFHCQSNNRFYWDANPKRKIDNESESLHHARHTSPIHYSSLS